MADLAILLHVRDYSKQSLQSDYIMAGFYSEITEIASVMFHLFPFRSTSQDQIQLSKSTDNLSNTSSTDGSGPDRKFTLPLKSIRPDLDKFVFAPDVEEVRVSPVVARKGWLNFLDEKSNGWIKKWVVCSFAVMMYNKPWWFDTLLF